jgi:MFS family permease
MNLPDVPRLVWVLAGARFFGSASSFMMLFLTLYLTGPRDLAVPTAGLVAGGYGVGMLVGNFTGGRWGDRWGHRRVLLVASTVSGTGVIAIPWVPVWFLAASLPVVAYLAATAGVCVGALTALAVPRGDRRTSVAIGRAASNAGFVIGPPLGAVLLSQSYDLLFVVDGSMILLVRFVLAPSVPAPGCCARCVRTGPWWCCWSGWCSSTWSTASSTRRSRCTCATRDSRWRSTPPSSPSGRA